jgi:hypothetical protein
MAWACALIFTSRPFARFETYFPHIDNVYSHRSTQRYKRRPFVSHYWDCRMIGRPPGTPKSDDPNKRKRKRSTRERDLCGVKIKITEYFDGATLSMIEGALPQPTSAPSAIVGGDGPVEGVAPSSAKAAGVFAASSAGTDGRRFWTIQRVNGNGGNGKAEGVAGAHKHTLERSDEIKKNSVQRWLAAQEKEVKKKIQVSKDHPANSLRQPPPPPPLVLLT